MSRAPVSERSIRKRMRVGGFMHVLLAIAGLALVYLFVAEAASSSSEHPADVMVWYSVLAVLGLIVLAAIGVLLIRGSRVAIKSPAAASMARAAMIALWTASGLLLTTLASALIAGVFGTEAAAEAAVLGSLAGLTPLLGLALAGSTRWWFRYLNGDGSAGRDGDITGWSDRRVDRVIPEPD